MLRRLALAALALSALSTAACAEPVADSELGYAGIAELSEGAAATTSRGAFKVTVWTADGAPHEGENTFFVRVAMPDPNDALADGRGIPNAVVVLDAHGGDDLSQVERSSAYRVTEQPDGVYEVQGVLLSAGDWQIDLDIAVGETIEDDVTFYFSI